jgi:hypothetical protein
MTYFAVNLAESSQSFSLSKMLPLALLKNEAIWIFLIPNWKTTKDNDFTSAWEKK